MDPYYCATTPITLEHFWDFSFAPTLLLYAYIPIIIISLIFSIVILVKDNGTARSKLLFLITLLFIFWIINVIFQWVAVYAKVVFFTSQLTALFEILIFGFSVYFIDVFTNKKDSSFPTKIILSSVVGAVLFLLPTKINMSSFDIVNCEGVVGTLWNFIYPFEILAIGWIIFIGMKAFYQKGTERAEKKQIAILTVGMTLFLGIFSLSNIFGETLNTYSINLVGPIGMVIFLGLLGYMIVKFKAFNVKLIATQAFMFALIAMIGAQLFFIKVLVNFLLTGITLAVSIIVGGLLIRSVKREVAQREEIENLAKSLSKSNDKLFVLNEKLKELNKQKTEFVSMASHQLRSPLTAIKGYSSMLLEGSFGPVEEKARGAIDVIFQSSQRLVTVIEDFLNITRIELGRMKYEISVFDLGQLAQTVIKDQEPNVKKHGLTIEFQDGTGNHQISADSGKVTQVISNIIDNSIKYTPSGGIKIKVENLPESKSKTNSPRGSKATLRGGGIRLTVSDTGVGIPKETLPKLFEKFVRADDAGKTNISGTGLGLYVAKQIVESLGGKIWAESEGKDKGSQFMVEFPRSSGEVTATDHKIESYTKTDLPTLQSSKK